MRLKKKSRLGKFSFTNHFKWNKLTKKAIFFIFFMISLPGSYRRVYDDTQLKRLGIEITKKFKSHKKRDLSVEK